MFHQSLYLFVLSPLVLLAADAGGKSGTSQPPLPETKSLEQQLAELRAENEQLKAAALVPPPARSAIVVKTPWPASLILTRSEHAALSPAEQTRFRALDGTVTEDPAPKE